LVTGGRLIGVLDVQSAQLVSLTREDLSVLQTLANQVAIAIENAQLFAANQKTLQTLQRAYGNLSREAWQSLLRAQPNRGYRAVSMDDPAPVTEEWQPDMILARESGKIVIGPTANDVYTLAVPIKIRDQITGVVRLRKPPEAGAWRQEEVALVVTLSDRLSAALESARLYEETRRTAERERLTGEITAHMRSTNDPRAILQIAARELRKALQADKAQLVVQASVSPAPGQTDDHPETLAGGQP
jgi:GAF domain-containing protein